MEFMVFQVYAPLVSWGDIAVGGIRRSHIQPSRSAILGLIGAALGIKRSEEDKHTSLANNFGIAVKLHSGGSLLEDYHTSQVPKQQAKVTYHTRRAELMADSDKIGTVLSRREYRCDAFSLIAVYTKNTGGQYSLQELSEHLNNPVFHIYFGRKSCVPALPLSPQIIKAQNLREAFSNYPINFPLPVNDDIPDWLQKVYEDYPRKTLFSDSTFYYWEDGVDSGFDHELQSVERYDQLLSRQRWQFTYRREYMAVENEGGENVHK